MSQLFWKPVHLIGSISLAAVLGFHGASAMAQDAMGYTVHEWGTFTSLQGSNGKNQEGMHHEEERLPPFVLGRCGGGVVHGDAKCADFLPEANTSLAVTQKMETPVIYFYGGEGQSAEVTVDFPRGVISQWFPAASSFLPRIRSVQAVAGGSMTWKIAIKSADSAFSHQVAKDNSWTHARNVDANTISVGPASEKFIFYRGLGQFDTALHVESDASGALRMVNTSNDLVPAVFLLGFDGQKGFVKALGPVAGQEAIPVSTLPIADKEQDAYLKVAQDLVKNALIDSGLYPKEAEGMVKTWEKSYFLTAGLRVLYVLPRRWSDAILPLSIKPEPKELVRTLVGRIEIMTRQEEVQTLAAMTAALQKGKSFAMSPWGRLQEAKLRRILSLSRDPQFTQAVEQALEQVETCTIFPCR